MRDKKANQETLRAQPESRMSYEEFLEWCDEDTWAEWVDGEVVMVSAATTRHQRLGRFLLQVVGIYVEARAMGEVFGPPFPVKLPNLPRGREPDLIFVSAAQADIVQEMGVMGAADLVVEIVSPGSVGRDRGEKFVEYEAGGVREYWLIDPQRRQAEFYHLGDNGLYRAMPVDADGVFRSEVVPGFWLKVDWLWQEPLPKALEVLQALGVR